MIDIENKEAIPVVEKEKGFMPEVEVVGNMIFKRGMEIGMNSMLSLLKTMLEEEEVWEKLIRQTIDDTKLNI